MNKSKSVNVLKTESTNIETTKEHEIPPKNRKKINGSTIWTLKITGITLVLAIIISFITEITSSAAHVAVSFVLLGILIAISIFFDAIGVAATSCDIAPLLSMAARKIKGAKVAVKLIQNAEKVSNICGDVIGDMCGIISGSAAAAIVIKIAIDNPNMYIISIIMSSVIAAITVGGKAFCKAIAIKRSKDIIMFTSKVLSIFYRPEK
ncbi:MAG TPA: CNNM domain-containing protein [Clostridia bacterium]|nr:CNNM domain-containing protein [Clostridia bacterium]